MAQKIDPNLYVEQIDSIFKENQNVKNAKEMKNYMKDKFEFYGIKAPDRRELVKEYMKKANRLTYVDLHFVIIKLWQLPQREHQYFAIELLQKYNKEFEEKIIELFEYMVTNKSWWDTVDVISKKLVGEYFKSYEKNISEYMEKWLNSDNIWLKRAALLFQLGYKEDTDEELMFELIRKLKEEEGFFLQKAIGWSLREYSKVKPESVKQFIENTNLSGFARKEGMKRLKEYSPLNVHEGNDTV